MRTSWNKGKRWSAAARRKMSKAHMGNVPWNKGLIRPIEDRFFEKVNKTKTCWLWTGCITTRGYPQFYSGKPRPNHVVYAHAWAYKHFIGSVPTGMWVLHSCDVPHCVNPKHLWAGTPKENQQDCVRKGRKRWPAHFPKYWLGRKHKKSTILKLKAAWKRRKAAGR